MKIYFFYLDLNSWALSESKKLLNFEVIKEQLDRFSYKVKLEVYKFIVDKFYS